VTEYLPTFIMMAVPVLLIGTVVLLNWLTRRKDRHARNRTA
jgi:hypothetical protein